MKLFPFLALILFIGACSSPKDGPATTEADLRKGTQALSFQFLPGSPPDTVYESAESTKDGVFNVLALLNNQGASNIEHGVLTLSLEKNYFTVFPETWLFQEKPSPPPLGIINSIGFALAGKSLENQQGDKALISVLVKTKQIESLSEFRKSSLSLTACYDYQTKATIPVCIDTDPHNIKKLPKACQVKDVGLSDQGAPVAVTNAKIQMLPTGQDSATLEVTLTFANKGEGLVISLFSDEKTIEQPLYENLAKACTAFAFTEKTTMQDKNKQQTDFFNTLGLDLRLSTDAENLFQCSPLPIKLHNKQQTVRCVYKGNLPKSSSYSTVLNVHLSYGYTQTIAKDITIERNPALHESI